jgi:ankyrin repeat protein
MHLFHRRLPFIFFILLAQGKGANVNEKSTGGMTALMGAAYNGCKDVIEHLVVRRTDVRDKYIESHAGADDGSLSRIQFLL